jgi:hypothetical protein
MVAPFRKTGLEQSIGLFICNLQKKSSFCSIFVPIEGEPAVAGAIARSQSERLKSPGEKQFHRCFYDQFKKIVIDWCVVLYWSLWSSGESQLEHCNSGREQAVEAPASAQRTRRPKASEPRRASPLTHGASSVLTYDARWSSSQSALIERVDCGR